MYVKTLAFPWKRQENISLSYNVNDRVNIFPQKSEKLLCEKAKVSSQRDDN
jgi:hypothetical protein